MPSWVIGAIIGAFLGWLIAALRSRARHVGGGWVNVRGMGCGATLFLIIVFGVIGTIIGVIVGS